jgi:hypothetical protein
VIEFAKVHWAETIALATALLSAWCVTALVDLFGPQGNDQTTRRLIFLVAWPLGFTVAYTLWTIVDTTTPDPFVVRALLSLVFCAICSIGAPFASRIVLALVKWKWPDLNLSSAFTKAIDK